jgi:hypothetical protein
MDARMADHPPRKTGRPPLDAADPSTMVCLSLPSKHYDRLYRAARTARCTIPEIVRRVLSQHLPPDKPGPPTR